MYSRLYSQQHIRKFHRIVIIFLRFLKQGFINLIPDTVFLWYIYLTKDSRLKVLIKILLLIIFIDFIFLLFLKDNLENTTTFFLENIGGVEIFVEWLVHYHD